MSYFNEYGTDFSVFNSGHGVLGRTVIDSKTGFEKRTVASSVCCFVGAVERGRGGGTFNGGKSRKGRLSKAFRRYCKLTQC